MTKGELNPRAVLSDDEIELMRSLRESENHVPRAKRYWTGPRLAEKFEVTLRHVRYVLAYQRRTAQKED